MGGEEGAESVGAREKGEKRQRAGFAARKNKELNWEKE